MVFIQDFVYQSDFYELIDDEAETILCGWGEEAIWFCYWIVFVWIKEKFIFRIIYFYNKQILCFAYSAFQPKVLIDLGSRITSFMK